MKLKYNAGTPMWNNDMFNKHRTPYNGLAGMVERLRVLRIKKLLKLSKEDTVLELGCESGYLLTSLPKTNKMVGFDISDVALGELSKNLKAKKMGIITMKGDLMDKLPFKKGQFKVIICSETLEHTINPSKAIKNIFDISDVHTRLIISVPNEKVKVVIKKWLQYLKIMDILTPGIEHNKSEWHLHSFSRNKVTKMLIKYFKIIRSESVLGLHTIIEARVK